MVDVAVVGSSEFIVGFQLAGIRNVVEVGENPAEDVEKVKEEKKAGIVIVDGGVLEKIEPFKRAEIEESVDPVFIPVSTNSDQESLRRLIKKSIGVDLWK